jgi:hypothetical protein
MFDRPLALGNVVEVQEFLDVLDTQLGFDAAALILEDLRDVLAHRFARLERADVDHKGRNCEQQAVRMWCGLLQVPSLICRRRLPTEK